MLVFILIGPMLYWLALLQWYSIVVKAFVEY